MKIFALMMALLCQPLLAGSPTETVAAFAKAATEQNLEEAWKHTAQFEGASPELTAFLKARTANILRASAEGNNFAPVEEKINGDCAVVTVIESTKGVKKAFSIDPAFLIKQKGEWKVMPKITQWDLTDRIPPEHVPPSMKLDAAKVAAYKELEKWFETKEKELKEKRDQARKKGQ